MNFYQNGVLAEVPPLARYLTFVLKDNGRSGDSVRNVSTLVDGEKTVLGIGQSCIQALDKEIPGLRSFPHFTGPGIDIPATSAALWFWLRGEDRGELVHRGRRIEQSLAPAFELTDVIDGFRYKSGFDLTGYEDGTENPDGEDAVAAAIVHGRGEGLDGSSFVAVQQWIHDLDIFEQMSPEQQDNVFGRRQSDNQEFDDAPETSHVKRAAQESFTPEAFVLRRSMPWSDEFSEGLVFVAFGKSFDAFETILKRMSGNEDGLVDALFGFTRPVTGAYFWCPPVKEGRLNLAALGLD